MRVRHVGVLQHRLCELCVIAECAIEPCESPAHVADTGHSPCLLPATMLQRFGAARFCAHTAAHMQGSILVDHCTKCSAQAPIVAYVGKLFPKPDASAFEAFTRVFSGSVKVGDKIRVLGEAYTPDDEEDSAVAEVTGVSVFMGRYRIPVQAANAGARSSGVRLASGCVCFAARCALACAK